MKKDVADLSLAAEGKKRILWANNDMPVLAVIRKRFEKNKPLKGKNVSACLHITAETANLAKTLKAGGANVVLCASNPLSTQDEITAALASKGVHVYAWKFMDAEGYYRSIGNVINARPNITIDDGADLVSILHKLKRGETDEEVEVQKI